MQKINVRIMLFVSALFLPGCGEKALKTQAKTERITESVYASGIIKSRNQYQVFASVSGLIQHVWVNEGALVKAGDPLFSIQGESARLNAENAALSADFAESNRRGERIREFQSAIENARSKMLNDSMMLLRQRELWSQQIGSKIELEQRELAFTTASNAYTSALARYNDLLRQLDFSAAQSKKLLSISRTQKEEFIVRSKINGRVYSIAKQTGELVSPQAPIAIIGAADEFIAELQVDESDIASIRRGQIAYISMDSYKGQFFEGAIHNIYPIMNERTQTFTVEANFTKMAPLLYPNLSLEANILIQSKDQAIIIPRNYLLEDSLVLPESGGKRRVKVGLKDFQNAEILEGLQAGEYILKPTNK